MEYSPTDITSYINSSDFYDEALSSPPVESLLITHDIEYPNLSSSSSWDSFKYLNLNCVLKAYLKDKDTISLEHNVTPLTDTTLLANPPVADTEMLMEFDDGNSFKYLHLMGVLKTYIKDKDTVNLKKFLTSLTDATLLASPLVAYAKVLVEFDDGNFDTVKCIIQNGTFMEKHHKALCNIWNNTLHKQFEKENDQLPDEVQRRRLHKKHPWPSSISEGKNGVRDKYHEILLAFYANKARPTLEEKELLASQTKYSVKQISTWFKNRRNRSKPKPSKSNDEIISELATDNDADQADEIDDSSNVTDNAMDSSSISQ